MLKSGVWCDCRALIIIKTLILKMPLQLYVQLHKETLHFLPSFYGPEMNLSLGPRPWLKCSKRQYIIKTQVQSNETIELFVSILKHRLFWIRVQPFVTFYSISFFPEQIAEPAIPLTTSECQGKRKVKQFSVWCWIRQTKNFFPNFSPLLLTLHII